MLLLPIFVCTEHVSLHNQDNPLTAQYLWHDHQEERDMVMTEFTSLPQKEKVRLLYEQGVYIGKRKQGTIIVVLYQLEGFYAEVYYRIYRREIDHISCFSGTARLDPYLQSIDVEHLVM